MNNKILKVCALLAVPVVALGASSCGKKIGENKSYYLRDDGVFPTVAAPYEQESRAAIERWKDAGRSQKQEVANEVAAELFAYACYNEEYVDKYVYFSSQTGYTDLGKSGYGNITTQNYKLIIHEGEDTPGYKYHYNIKKVNEASGTINNYKGLFENARLRFVVDTNKLYRFEVDGDDSITYVADEETGEPTDLLTCKWKTGNDWGKDDDDPIVKREGEKLDLAGIEADIAALADEGEAVIHGNVNILAEGIVKQADITEGKADGHTVYEITMELDPEVANADAASQAMLKNANSASRCEWVTDEEGKGPVITFQIWENGLMKYYRMDEQWEGKITVAIFGYEGGATAGIEVWYSYSDYDTDMTEKLAMLEGAIAAK